MNRNLRFLTGLCAAVLLAAAAAARGDGVMMPRIEELGRSGRMVASPKQEAILIVDGNAVRVILRTHFHPGPEELAWVVPVPARPTDIKPADDSVFTVLEEQTAPRFYRTLPAEGPTFGCGCGAMGWNQGAAEPVPAVRVEEVGTAGMFEYAVLSSRDANELGLWLRDHQYAIPPGAAAVFESYVKSGWHWLAMRIRAEARADMDLAPHPISYTYRSDRLVYPLAISRVSADEDSEIVLYVAADERFASTNWSNVVAGNLAIRPDPGAASGTDYASVLRTETGRNSGRLFVTEFAGSIEDVEPAVGLRRRSGYPLMDLGPRDRPTPTGSSPRWLTRLRAVAPREALDRDVLLAPFTEGHWIGSPLGSRVVNQLHVRIEGPSPARLASPLAPAALAGLGLALRRGRRWRKALAPPLLLAAALGFAML